MRAQLRAGALGEQLEAVGKVERAEPLRIVTVTRAKIGEVPRRLELLAQAVGGRAGEAGAGGRDQEQDPALETLAKARRRLCDHRLLPGVRQQAQKVGVHDRPAAQPPGEPAEQDEHDHRASRARPT